MRIHELAKELGVQSKDILSSLEEMGYESRTASSTVPDEAVPRLRAAGGHVKPGSKPIGARVQPLPRGGRREGRQERLAVSPGRPAVLRHGLHVGPDDARRRF